ncbi:unnamed protein product [Callosobruchus maculatus]|uniref:Uncharacterized protein n=1 Tax=Callosobruchus maculatus TaxID=64391 RepID=A0A653D7S5_CALMS|nr:unnamed protein product [Callosobruchus maculatus]
MYLLCLKASYALHVTVLCLKLGTLCMCLLCLKASYALHETVLCLKLATLCTKLFYA